MYIMLLLFLFFLLFYLFFYYFLNNRFELLQLRMEVGNVRLLLLLTMEALLCLKQGNSNRYNCLFFG